MGNAQDIPQGMTDEELLDMLDDWSDDYYPHGWAADRIRALSTEGAAKDRAIATIIHNAYHSAQDGAMIPADWLLSVLKEWTVSGRQTNE